MLRSDSGGKGGKGEELEEGLIPAATNKKNLLKRTHYKLDGKAGEARRAHATIESEREA